MEPRRDTVGTDFFSEGSMKMQEQKVGEGEGRGKSHMQKSIKQTWGSLKLMHDPQKDMLQRGGST